MKTADVVIKVKLADKAKGEDVLTFRYKTGKEPKELFSALAGVVFAEPKSEPVRVGKEATR